MTLAEQRAREALEYVSEVGGHTAAAHHALRRYLDQGDPSDLVEAEQALGRAQHHLTRAKAKTTGVRIHVQCREQTQIATGGA